MKGWDTGMGCRDRMQGWHSWDAGTRRAGCCAKEPDLALRLGWQLHAPSHDRTVPSSGYFSCIPTAILPIAYRAAPHCRPWL